MDDTGYAEYRPLMFSIAYRMTGSVSDAEDIVQEAFLRVARTGTADIASPRAYLATMTTRLAIDHLRLARVRRESYVGTWLPEPLVADDARGPAEQVEMSDSLSLAFLVLLESLSPVERAVFLLREVFGYGYGEIAGAVGKSEANCRQIFTRARRHVDEGRPRFHTSRAEGEELVRRFLDAAGGGDMAAFVERLAPDVVFYGDGGGRGGAARGPVHGRQRVARFIAGIAVQTGRLGGVSMQPTWINGQPGLMIYDAAGAVLGVIAFDVLDGMVQAIRSVINPDKLHHLGTVSDIWQSDGTGD